MSRESDIPRERAYRFALGRRCSSIVIVSLVFTTTSVYV